MYLNACKSAILDGWSDLLLNDCASGNCFQILGYGIKSSCKVLLSFIARFLLALFFPLSAFLVMKSDKKRKVWESKIKAELDKDL